MENFEVSFNMNDYLTADTNDNMIETFETEGSIEAEFVDVFPNEDDVQETSAWTALATKMLICLRGQNNAQFEKSKKKGQKALIWKKVADEMKQDGYYFDASQCDEKWRRLLFRYHQVRDSSKKSGSGGIKWQYYELMRDALSPLARQAVYPPEVYTMDFNMALKTDIKVEPMNFPDVDIPNSCGYDEGIIQNMKNEDSMEDKITDQTYPIQNHQSESETEDIYDECYSCFMCNVSYNTQFDLDAHLRTHIDDDTFHHSNINSISEPLPQSSIKPSKYFRCNECLKICKSQLSYNEHMLTHTGEKPHHCRVCDRKFRHIANFRTHLKSHNNVRTLICSLCRKTIVGEKNYYIHYMDVHNKMSIRNPRPYQSSSSDSDEDFNPKVSYYKKKKLNSRKFRKDSEPFGPLFAKKAWEKKQRELENVNLDAEEEKSERDAVQEAIESSRQDIQNMLRKRKQQQTDYNTEEYQKFLETLILEKNTTGQLNEAKLIGPVFWKNALVKAGLIEEDIHPMQFQSQLRLIECISCRKCFARLPTSNEGNILPSKPPCSSCFMINNESTLNKHRAENHSEPPPYICKECLLESDTWYKYVQHMKMHLRFAAKCSECVYDLMNKPDTVIFLCHICEMSFDSDDELKVHVQTHLENGQNNDR